MFKQFHQQRRAPTLPPLQVKGDGFAGVGAGKGTPTPLSPSGRPLPIPPGPPSAGASMLSFHRDDEMPADIPPDVNIDLDDWELPKHMISQGSASRQGESRQPQSPGYAIPPTSPGSYLPNQPTSPGSYFSPVAGAPDFPPPSPAYSSGRMDIGAVAEQYGASARQGHGRTISQMSNPLPQRPRSVQIETVGDERQNYMDEMPSRHSLDRYGAEADAAVRESTRTHRSVESGSNRRSSTIASLTLEDNWDGTRRPDPIMVPLPDSPMSSRFNVSSRPPGLDSAEHRGVALDERDILDNALEMPSLLPELGGSFTPRLGGQQRLSLNLDQLDSRSDVGEVRLERRPSLVYFNDQRPSSIGSMGQPSSFYGTGSDVDIGSPTRPVFDDIPSAEEYGRPLRPPKYGNMAYRMARQQLLRPKTLIMPGMLEGTERLTATVHIPDGFTLGEKPLPEDARASILNQGKGVPLSLAQKTFRSSLMVGGTREDEFFQGQAQEGEMVPGISEEERFQVEQERRGPGKLYGTSLIDQLEARKTQQASRKRVFYGDNRPSMMARSEQTKSMYLDPNPTGETRGALDARPKSYAPTGGDRPISYMPSDPRPKSYTPGVPPTINFPDEDHEDGDIGNAATTARQANTRSVFGVDTVWEREMAKLKQIQDAQANARAEAEAAERAKEEAKQAKLDARHSKMIDKAHNRKSFFAPGSGNSRKSMLNPEFVPENDPNFVRPMSIAFGPGGVIIPTGDDEADEGHEADESSRGNSRDLSREASPRASRLSDRPPTLVLEAESSDLGNIVPQLPGLPAPRRPASRLGAETWFAESDEESDDDAPLSSARKGKGKLNVAPPARPTMRAADSDSDEDVPLSRLKIVDSDEEVPLSQLRKKESVGTPTTATTASGRPGPLPNIKAVGGPLKLDLPFSSTPTSPISPGLSAVMSGAASGDDEKDEDDEPLFVRKARQRAAAPEKTAEEIDDDLPLGWKHAGAGGAGGMGARAQSFVPTTASFYGQNPYGSPYGVQSAYGMPGMGTPMMGMGMPMNPMAPPMMSQMGMGMPMGAGMMPTYQPGMEMPNPGSNIDKWRQNVAPGSVAGSVVPSVAPSQAGH